MPPDPRTSRSRCPGRWPLARGSSAAAAARHRSTSPRCARRSIGSWRAPRGTAAAAGDSDHARCGGRSAHRGHRACGGERHDPGGAAARPASLRKLAEGRFVISVEIDPPRSVRIERTLDAARLLAEAGVDLVNISDSAMARVRMSAMAVAFGIQHDLDLECLVHFTTRDRNLMALESELLGAHALGVRDILALTGDPPRIGDYPTGTGIWDIDSTGLIGVIKRLNRGEDQAGKPIGAPAGFTVACALDPTAGDLEHELDRLTGKLDAGADLIMTQPIYAREQWDRFMERASRRWGDRLPKPVLLGILPLHTSRHAEFLHNEVPGITIPDRVRGAMAAAGDRGAEVGLDLAMELLSGIRGLVQGTYVMPSFGRYELSAELVRRLRPPSRPCRLPPAPVPDDRLTSGAAPPMRGAVLGYAPPVMHGRRRAGLHRVISAVVAGMWLLLMLAGTVLAAGPPFPDRPANTHILDDANVFNKPPEEGVEEGLRAVLDSRGVDVVVYTQVKGSARDQADADADAQALLKQWAVGGNDGQGAVLLWDFDRQTSRALVSLALSDGLAQVVDAAAVTGPGRGVDDRCPAHRRLAQRPQSGRVHADRGAPRSVRSRRRSPPRRRPASVAPGATPAPRPTPRPGRAHRARPACRRGRTPLPCPDHRPAGLRPRGCALECCPPAGRGDHRGHRGTHRRPGRGLHPGQAGERHARTWRRRMHVPSSTSTASVARASMTGSPSCSTSTRASATARSSCTPRPATATRT